LPHKKHDFEVLEDNENVIADPLAFSLKRRPFSCIDFSVGFLFISAISSTLYRAYGMGAAAFLPWPLSDKDEVYQCMNETTGIFRCLNGGGMLIIMATAQTHWDAGIWVKHLLHL
jgi:hypothetical protein